MFLNVAWEIAVAASVSVQSSLFNFLSNAQFIISSSITGIYIKDIVFHYIFRYLILSDSELFFLEIEPVVLYIYGCISLKMIQQPLWKMETIMKNDLL